MAELELIQGGDDGFLSTRKYRGSGGERLELRYKGEEHDRAWYWRHPAGPWHGPFRKLDWETVLDQAESELFGLPVGAKYVADLGKSKALLDAAHLLGKSGMAMDWQPIKRWWTGNGQDGS